MHVTVCEARDLACSERSRVFSRQQQSAGASQSYPDLLRVLMSMARLRGANLHRDASDILTVVASNISAVRLYKGLGFEEYGLERRAMKIGSNYHDELLMALSLRKSR